MGLGSVIMRAQDGHLPWPIYNLLQYELLQLWVPVRLNRREFCPFGPILLLGIEFTQMV